MYRKLTLSRLPIGSLTGSADALCQGSSIAPWPSVSRVGAIDKSSHARLKVNGHLAPQRLFELCS